MAKKRKSLTAVQPAFPGLIFSDDRTSIGFRLDQVPVSDFYFYATDFRIEIQDQELILQFGSNSRLAGLDIPFDRAIEIYMALPAATDCFIANVFERESTKGHPFIKTLESAVAEENRFAMAKYKCNRDMPADTSTNLRTFTSNFASSSIFNAQCNIEFLLIPFTFVAYQHTGVVRPGDQVRSILNVHLPARIMYAFFLAARSILKNNGKETP